MKRIDLTYGGKIDCLINVLDKKKLDVNYTVEGHTGKPTTTSILINGSENNFLMITFDYQELKKLVEGSNDSN